MRHSALFSLLLILGCPTGDTNIGELDESTGQAEETSSATTGTQTEASTTESPDPGTSQTSSGVESSSTGSPPVAVCPASSQCSLPIDCESGEHDCGGITRFDEAGCPRDWCEDDGDCAGTDRCVDPSAWGVQCPFAHPCSDDEEDGTCSCDFGLSCGTKRHCVAAEAFPGNEGGPAACAARLDEGACETPLPGEPPGECLWVPYAESSPNPATCEEVTASSYACMFVTPRLPERGTPTPCPDGSGRVPWLSPGDGDPSPDTILMALLPNTDLRVGWGGWDAPSWISCSSGDPYGICDCICELE